MSTNSITIPVRPAASHLPGTVGWAQQQLRQVRLEVRATNGVNGRNRAAMFYAIGEGKCTNLLAFIGQAKEFGLRNPDSDAYVVHPAQSANIADRVYCVAPDTSDHKQGLFYYLTPAAWKLVDAFLDDAVAALRAALDHDDDVAELSFRVEFGSALTAE